MNKFQNFSCSEKEPMTAKLRLKNRDEKGNWLISTWTNSDETFCEPTGRCNSKNHDRNSALIVLPLLVYDKNINSKENKNYIKPMSLLKPLIYQLSDFNLKDGIPKVYKLPSDSSDNNLVHDIYSNPISISNIFTNSKNKIFNTITNYRSPTNPSDLADISAGNSQFQTKELFSSGDKSGNRDKNRFDLPFENDFKNSKSVLMNKQSEGSNSVSLHINMPNLNLEFNMNNKEQVNKENKFGSNMESLVRQSKSSNSSPLLRKLATKPSNPFIFPVETGELNHIRSDEAILDELNYSEKSLSDLISHAVYKALGKD